MPLTTYVAGNVLTAAQLNGSFDSFKFTSAIVATSQTTTSGTFTDLATVGPSVTLTTGTTALVILTGRLSIASVNQAALMGFAVSGATTIAAADASCIYVDTRGAIDQTVQCTAIYQVTLTAGSNVFTAKYRSTTGTATFVNRGLLVGIIP
jgi:hypothetical protein